MVDSEGWNFDPAPLITAPQGVSTHWKKIRFLMLTFCPQKDHLWKDLLSTMRLPLLVSCGEIEIPSTTRLFWDQVYQDFVSSERVPYVEPSVNQPEILHQSFEEGDFQMHHPP